MFLVKIRINVSLLHSTTVPNDQGAFANWLYRIPGKTCKEGGREACLAGTDGGQVPWLNQAS